MGFRDAGDTGRTGSRGPQTWVPGPPGQPTSATALGQSSALLVVGLLAEAGIDQVCFWPCWPRRSATTPGLSASGLSQGRYDPPVREPCLCLDLQQVLLRTPDLNWAQ